MRHKFFLNLIILFLCIPDVYANEKILASIPNVSVVGIGVLSYAFWDVYKATLYAPKGRWDKTKPFTLSIEYYHPIKGGKIADRSVQEIRKQGFTDEIKLATWNAQMKKIFPDVENGTILWATYFPGNRTIFYKKDKVIGTVNDDYFGKLFFGIWLDEKTSKPELRRALLGMS